VEREFQLRPVLNEEYRQLMKLRNEDSNTPKRSIQVVDSVQGGVKLGIIVPLNENELMKKKRKQLPDQKRERLPRPELMDLLFSAFEKYTHWNLKGLVEYSQQPTVGIEPN
jgi:transcription initiation factor TFIIF subunit beta